MFLQQEEPDVEADAVLSALSNDYDRRILALAQREPVTAQELLTETSIPKSTLYRRVNDLEDEGLLEVVDAAIDQGRRVDRYACPLVTASVTIEGGDVQVGWERESDDRDGSWPQPSL